MKIHVRTSGDTRIVDCSGKITMGEGTKALRNTIHDIIEGGSDRIVLNLAHTGFIDSSGIGELVHAHNSISEKGGQMKLVNLKKKLRDPLIIAKLMTVLDTADSEEAAIAAFK